MRRLAGGGGSGWGSSGGSGGARTSKLGPEEAGFGDFACLAVLNTGKFSLFSYLIRMEFLHSQQISNTQIVFYIQIILDIIYTKHFTKYPYLRNSKL